MRKTIGFIAVVVVVLALMASPGHAISGVSGLANSDNTILKVQVGSTVVRLGTDLADSFNTSLLKSTGQIITGQVGDATLAGGATRTANSASQSGSTNIGTGTKSIAGLASLNVVSGKISNLISTSKVTSAVDFVVGNVNALGGFTNIGATNSATDSVVGKSSSVVSRDVSIGDVEVLDLRTLLDQLGVNPLAIACDAIESTGATLGVDTSAACSTLSSVTGALGVGADEIDGLETVLGVLETALAPLCAAAPAGTCDTVLAQINDVQSDIDAFQADPASSCSAFDEAIDTIGGGVNTVLTTLNGLSGGALPDISALLSPVSSQLSVLDTAVATVNSTCATLLGIVDGLLDTSLLSLDLINVTMDLAAKVNPTATATGAIGALKVGNLTVVDANDLIALGSQLNSAVDTVESTLGGVLDATGLGLAAPSLDLLKVTTSKGKNSAGSYFAKAAMTVAHLGIPSANLELPSNLPLDVLGGLGGFAPVAVQAAAVTTPAVSVDAGVFSGDATWKAASSTPTGGQLPVTGVADSGLAFAGLLTLIGAGIIRRFAKVF